MSKEELIKIFKEMFPNWGNMVKSYKKIGSRALAITFHTYMNSRESGVVCDEEHNSKVFLYYDEFNWQFGTKLFRKKPVKNHKEEEKENE